VSESAIIEIEQRAKYNADELKALQAKGHTLPGGTSYPIDDADDLDKAIHAVGRGGADHDAIRKYIIGRAKAMGESEKIPENWDPDGSMDSGTEAEESAPDGDERAKPPRQGNWATPKARSLFVQPGCEWTPPQLVDSQVRMSTSDDGSHLANFRGFPSPTGVAYSVRDWLGEYDETIYPGAWAKTIQESRAIPTLLNHNMDGVPLASTGGESPTKELAESDRGLREDSIFDRRSAQANEVCLGLERGDLGKMSITFRAIKETWNDTYDKRGVAEGALYESSIVTFPASPTADGGLVDAMRSALGREGRSLWLSADEPSIRSVLPVIVEQRGLPDDGEDMVEKALRALAHADEVVGRAAGSQGRARTFLVAESLLEMRAGKVLSAKSAGLIKTALDALSSADKNHAKVGMASDSAKDALGQVLDASAQASTEGSGEQGGDGKAHSTPPGNGNPINPQDGAGPRSLPPSVLAARRQVERLRRGRVA
jgi:HK97 family phage prohead protease